MATTPYNTVTGAPGIDPCSSGAGVRPGPGTTPKVQAWTSAGYGVRWAITVAGPRWWPGHLSKEAAVVRLVLWGVVILAEQAPNLSDEQVRSRLVALGELVR